jgi:C-terminal peptidase prc
LQIVYTTILARYDERVSPRTLVDGARTGVVAYLGENGIENADAPFTPPRIDAGAGEDLVDALVVRALARYGKRLDGHRLVQAAVAGELAALHDPYSLLFRPRAFAKFNAFLGNGSFGGIGAVVSLDRARGEATIDRVLPGSPAARAGLARGDAIVAVDGRAVRELGDGAALRDVLRGKIGTPVTLAYHKYVGTFPIHDTVATFHEGATTSVTLVRAAVRDPEVTTARFGDVGYLALSRFGDRAGDELAAALRDFKADGVRGIVLDLRANGGGYGDEATAVASLFLPSGPVFTTRERGGTPTVARATGTPDLDGPARRARGRRHGLGRRDRGRRDPRRCRGHARRRADVRQRRRPVGVSTPRRQRREAHDGPLHDPEGPRHRSGRHPPRHRRRRTHRLPHRRPRGRSATRPRPRALGRRRPLRRDTDPAANPGPVTLSGRASTSSA